MYELGKVLDANASLAEFPAAQRELEHELRDLGIGIPPVTKYLTVFEQGRLAALCMQFETALAASVFVRPAFRGRGIGDYIVEALVERGQDLLVHERSRSRGYFEERGYFVIEERDGAIRLRPPTRASGVRPAASICLFNSASREVLIGRRLTPPWPEYWAFPGGKLDPGEAALAGGLRELWEETGVRIETDAYLLQTRVYAGGSGAIYSVDNFCIECSVSAAPEPGPELAARWLSLSDAMKLRPLAAGTRRVLRRLTQRLQLAATQR